MTPNGQAAAHTETGYSAGRRTRAVLLDAVLRIVGRDGVGAVTHRRVNREAGVANGLTTYHFSTKHKLLCAAYEYWISDRLAHAEEMVAGLARASRYGERRALAIEALVEATAVELESDTAAAGFALAREPALAGRFDDWEARLLAVFEAGCRSMGSRSPNADAWILLSTMRGLQLAHLSAGGRRPDRARLGVTYTRLVDALAALEAVEEKE